MGRLRCSWLEVDCPEELQVCCLSSLKIKSMSDKPCRCPSVMLQCHRVVLPSSFALQLDVAGNRVFSAC